MQQVLFTVAGIPIHAFGVVLFVCFIVCTRFALTRARPLGFTWERMQDLGLVLFVCGLVGARTTYMIQYHRPIAEFPFFWEGGIVLYGSIIGGFVGYWFFYFVVLKPLGIRTWQLADALAPALALGIAIGRVGCLLNGCCYGQVAPDSCPRIAFPLTTAPARELVVDNAHYQTVTGFTLKSTAPDDVRSVISRVEKGSSAERAGLLPGDKIVKLYGKPNRTILGLIIAEQEVDLVAAWFESHGGAVERVPEARATEPPLKVRYDDPAKAAEAAAEAQRTLPVRMFVKRSDSFRELIGNWPKGRHDLELTVDRDGKEINLDFTPRSLGLHPTQIYESISMVLLTLLLLAFFPFRRHDGQVFVLFILCYAVHRFLNEILRDDTTPVAFNMTLSQNVSLLMLSLGVGLEIWLRVLDRRKRAIVPAGGSASGVASAPRV